MQQQSPDGRHTKREKPVRIQRNQQRRRQALQKKTALAQQQLAEIENHRAAQQLRRVNITHTHGSMFALVNNTGHTIHDVRLSGCGNNPVRVLRDHDWPQIDDQDKHEFMAEPGGLRVCWIDHNGDQQSRIHQLHIS